MINNSGQIAFTAFLSGTVGFSHTQGLFRRDGGNVTQIARSDTSPPDGNGVFGNFSRVAINSSGQMAFPASFSNTSGAGDNLGILFYDDLLGLRHIVRTGDPCLGSTITALSARYGNGGAGGTVVTEGDERSGLNELGQFAYQFTLADGREGVAIWSPPTPLIIAVTSVSSGPSTITINWITTPPGSPVDVYRTVDLLNWGSPISTANAGATFTDNALPGDMAFYVVVAAGQIFP